MKFPLTRTPSSYHKSPQWEQGVRGFRGGVAVPYSRLFFAEGDGDDEAGVVFFVAVLGGDVAFDAAPVEADGSGVAIDIPLGGFVFVFSSGECGGGVFVESVFGLVVDVHGFRGDGDPAELDVLAGFEVGEDVFERLRGDG